MLYCYNLLINAHGCIGNTCAVLYYLKEIDKDIMMLPEEIKDIQIDIDMNITELKYFVNGWYEQAFGGQAVKSSKFAIWRIKMQRNKDEFK